VLGFVASEVEDTVILLCRETCRSTGVGNLPAGISDLSSWSPLIQDRQLLSWLARVPEGPGNFSLSCSVAAINKLEERWSHGERTLQIDQLANAGIFPVDAIAAAVQDPVPIPLQFSDGPEYWQLFVPLLELEAKADRHLKESVGVFENVRIVRSEISPQFCTMPLIRRDDCPAFLLGDELKLKTSDFHINVFVVKISRDDVTLEFKRKLNKKEHDLFNSSPSFTVSYVWKSTSFDRMRVALRRFANDPKSVSVALYHAILGRPQPPSVSDSQSPASLALSSREAAGLNPSQLYAVKKALETSGVCLIQGPPGTGKSTVSVAIVKELTRKQQQVLVCAPSNTAADHLTERLDKAGVKVVRVMARSREDVATITDGAGGGGGIGRLMLHNKWKELNREEQMKRKCEMEILRKAEVIVTTCAGAGDGRLSEFKFKSVLIDEATQATEPETLIPIVHGCKQLILVGDHKQLGSVIIDKRAAKAGLKRSLFERMIDLNIRPVRLEIQYRMHPGIAEFPSAHFYEGSLQSGVAAGERKLMKQFPFPNEKMPQMFYHVAGGSEELSGSGTSYLNRSEASAVGKLVNLFVKCGVDYGEIGIITPYDGQRQYLTQAMEGEVERGLEISSVDSFQGREKEVVVISMVRANNQGTVGFVGDARRLNVALTRARRALVVCGCANTLISASQKDRKNAIWLDLLRHFKKHQALVEGAIGNFRPAVIPIPTKQATTSKRHAEFSDKMSDSSFDVRSQR
jgi:regulator of nonsense transcripts 1